MVLDDADTVFGELPGDEDLELLPAEYRSHGSLHEQPVALFTHKPLAAPQAATGQQGSAAAAAERAALGIGIARRLERAKLVAVSAPCA